MTPTPLSPRQENLTILTLAGIQFCHIVDFMVLMPLGPQLMRKLGIGTAEFGLLVAAYTFSAGLMGFLAAFLIDRIDRRRMLLGIFAGFLLATLACGLAVNYETLLAARLLAGAFGGILGACVMALVGDCIPEARRGAATGKVMAAFSLAAVAGVPLGLYIANHANWRAPFLMVAIMGLFFAVMGWRVIPSVPGRQSGPLDITGTLKLVFGDSNHRRAFGLMIFLMLSGFSVIPFLSPYSVSNIGLTEAQLPLIYLCGGLATLVSSPLIGRLSDRIGKARALSLIAMLSLIPILWITNLPASPLWLALLVSTLFMVLVSGRIIPAMALITSASRPELRGRFLSFNTAMQQLAVSFSALWPTWVLTTDTQNRLQHFEWVGYACILTTIIAVFLVQKLEVRS